MGKNSSTSQGLLQSVDGEATEGSKNVTNQGTHTFPKEVLCTDWNPACSDLSPLLTSLQEAMDGVVRRILKVRRFLGCGEEFRAVGFVHQSRE